MPQLKRIEKENMIYYVPKKPVILKNVKSFTVFPVLEVEDLISKKRFIEAIMIASLRIEQNLKDIYFYTHCKQVAGVYHEIHELTFNKIINLTRASGIINWEEYKRTKLLKQARNEISHHPYANCDTVDETKFNSIVPPCLEIIKRTHDKLIGINDGSNKQTT